MICKRAGVKSELVRGLGKGEGELGRGVEMNRIRAMKGGEINEFETHQRL